MRRHFQRCSHLRVLTADAAELSGKRRGGGVVLEELCEAKQFAPCVGLVECDILSAGQKRELLVARATRMRHEEGPTPLSGVAHHRVGPAGGLGAAHATHSSSDGVCRQCGGSIETERLRLVPDTRLCLGCARRASSTA